MTFSNSLFAMNKGALLKWGVGSPSEMSENFKKKVERAASKLYHEEASRESNT